MSGTGPIGERTRAALAQRVHQLAGAALLQAQRHQRMCLAILPDQLRHKRMERGRAGEAEPDPAGLAARRPPGRADRVLDLLQDQLRLGQQGPPGLGQLDPARLAAEQLYLQFAFQRPDLLAQRRLLDAEPLGRARYVPRFGDRDKVSKMAQLHIENISKRLLTYIGQSFFGCISLSFRRRSESTLRLPRSRMSGSRPAPG